MDIRVSGHQIKTGSALQDLATQRLETIVEKHFSRAQSSHVTFGKAPANAFVCDIVMHVNNGLILKSRGGSHDARTAFDQAAEKIEKQLRRYKRRWKVERLFAWLFNSRRTFVRYEYHADLFLGMVQLACVMIVLKHYF